MNTQLNPVIAWQVRAELHRAGERARRANEVSAGERSLRDSTSTAGLTAHLADLTARSAPTRP